MTSQVKVTAHCSNDKQVRVQVTGQPDVILYDGQSHEVSIYDVRKVSAYEQLRTVEGDSLAPHQGRALIEEKAELDARANALSQFIGHSDLFDTFDPYEQERMKVQNDLMWQLSEVLGARIAAFNI